MLTEPERRLMVREVQAAQRILSAPDRHTHAVLAYAQARSDELLAALSADASEQLTALFQAVATAVQPVVVSTLAALRVWYEGMQEWAADHGTTIEALVEAAQEEGGG